MPTTLELCEKYFHTQDIYAILYLPKNANEKDVKKAYHRMSLQVHPDRVNEKEKEEAAEKFKVLTKINRVLSDSMKRAVYDEHGSIDDDIENNCESLNDWHENLERISSRENENFSQSYKGSDTEKYDIRKAYLDGKGCLNFMLKSVPFMTVEEEPRIIELVKDWISNGEVPEYAQFTKEPKAKSNRRHKRYGAQSMTNYSGVDDFYKVSPVKITKATAKKGPKKRQSKPNLNKVQNGRITKKNRN